jgi:hypothetical protein
MIPWRDRSLNSNVNDNGIINEDYHGFVLKNQQRDLNHIGKMRISVKGDILSFASCCFHIPLTGLSSTV